MSRLLAEIPPDLGEHRRRVYQLSDSPIIYSKAEWDVYWPFLDSIWLKHKHLQHSERKLNDRQTFICRLANKKPSEELKLANGAKKRRLRRIRTGCRMQMVAHFLQDTVEIHRQSDEGVTHNHDLDDVDRGKKSTGLRNLVGKLTAMSGGSVSQSFRVLLDTESPEEQAAIESIGAAHMNVSDISHAASVWKERNQSVEDSSTNIEIGERSNLATPQDTPQLARRTSRGRRPRRLDPLRSMSTHGRPRNPAPDLSEQSLQGRLMTELELAREAYVKRNPQSFRTHNESTQYMPGGNTRTTLHASPFPLTFASGKGPELVSIDGDRLIDFLGEYSAGIFGHDNPAIQAAIQDALSKGWNFGGQTRYEQQLAKTVCERFRPAVELVRFTSSGTEANMCAIAAAIAWTDRKKVMVFDGGYHGSTMGFPKPRLMNEMNIPHEWVVGAYDHIDRTRAILQSLPLYSLAAVIIEPMQGNAGARSCNPDFLRFLRNYTTQYGICLIFDEVQTSRLSYRGLGQKLGIKPDLLTLGKWVGGGMSFGAFGGRRDIMEMFDPSSGKLQHAGTFNNNVVTMAAGCVGCTILDERAISSLNAMGKRLKDLVHALLQSKGVESNIVGSQTVTALEVDGQESSSNATLPKMWMSGIGSILCLSFSGNGKDQLQALLYHHMLQENIYLSPRGFIALSIEIQESHVDRFVAALETFIDRYHTMMNPSSEPVTEQGTTASNEREQPPTATSTLEPTVATTSIQTPTPPSTTLSSAPPPITASQTPSSIGPPVFYGLPVQPQWSVRAPVTTHWSGTTSTGSERLVRPPLTPSQRNSGVQLRFLSPQTTKSVAASRKAPGITFREYMGPNNSS